MNFDVDLIGDEDGDFDSYFDPREFEAFAWLEDQHYWHIHRRTVLLEALEAHCPDRSRPLIELGCGAGTVATYLNQNGYQVDYGDVHREALRFARQRAEVTLDHGQAARRFIRVDITRTIPPGDYRGFLLFDVLEHLPDDVAAMRALHARMAAEPDEKNRGFVLFTVPAFSALWSPWDDMAKHKRRYTPGTARRLCEEVGFEVVRVTCFFFPLFFAAAAVKAIRLAKRAVVGKAIPPRALTDLSEARSHPALNRLMLGLLAPERRWLRIGNLPLGTSILVVARPASR